MLINLKLGPRLAAAFLLMAGFMLAIAAIGIAGLGSLNSDLQRIVDQRQPKIALIHEIVDETGVIGIALRNALLADTPAEAAPYLQRVESGRAQLGAQLESLDRGFEPDARGKEVQQALHTEYAAYTVEIVKVSRAITAGRRDIARAMLTGSFQERLTSYVAALRTLSGYEQGLMREAREGAAQSHSRGRNLILGIVLAAALATGVLALTLTRSITGPLLSAGTLADAIARGDLTTRVQVSGRDETAALARSLKSMQDRLAEIVTRIKHASHTVHSAAIEISTGNQNLSRRTEAHASALEETAASVEELTAAVRRNAESAEKANELAAGASTVAARGGTAVTRFVETMSAITTSSERIAEITAVIDNVAFQTNILALNAAVEAARAGDQGRGFAVVAAEVRTLAQRTTLAAKDIRRLIDESAKQVRQGSELGEDAGRTMTEVVGVVKGVSETIAQITLASREQRAGIEQLSSAITQMDHMTQQNAAMVEQVSAAATSLEQQAHALSGTVDIFALRDDAELPRHAATGPQLALLASSAAGRSISR